MEVLITIFFLALILAFFGLIVAIIIRFLRSKLETKDDTLLVDDWHYTPKENNIPAEIGMPNSMKELTSLTVKDLTFRYDNSESIDIARFYREEIHRRNLENYAMNTARATGSTNSIVSFLFILWILVSAIQAFVVYNLASSFF